MALESTFDAFLASLAEPEQDRMTDALAGASDREGTLLHLLSTMLPEGRKVILRGIQSRPEESSTDVRPLLAPLSRRVAWAFSWSMARIFASGQTAFCLLMQHLPLPSGTLDPLFRGGRWRQMACAKSATASRPRQA